MFPDQLSSHPLVLPQKNSLIAFNELWIAANYSLKNAFPSENNKPRNW